MAAAWLMATIHCCTSSMLLQGRGGWEGCVCEWGSRVHHTLHPDPFIHITGTARVASRMNPILHICAAVETRGLASPIVDPLKTAQMHTSAKEHILYNDNLCPLCPPAPPPAPPLVPPLVPPPHVVCSSITLQSLVVMRRTALFLL